EEFQDLDPNNLPQRNGDSFKEDANHVAQYSNNEDYIFQSGIRSHSIFHVLYSVIFPDSFPLDAMHLFFINIARKNMKHQRGRFFLLKKVNPKMFEIT